MSNRNAYDSLKPRPRSTKRDKARRPFKRFQPCCEAFEARTLLSTVTWINPSSGDWSSPSNWSTGALPGAGDDVVINQPGITVTHSSGADSVNSITSEDPINVINSKLSIASASTIDNSLSVSNGTLVLGGHLTVGGSMTLTGSFYLNGAGTVDANGGLTIQTGYLCQIQGVTLNNHGSATVSGSYGVGVGNGAVFNNLAGATLDVEGSTGFGYGGGAMGAINNAGTVTVANAGGVHWGVPVNSSGAVTVTSGSLGLDASGSFTGSASLTGAAGTSIGLDGPFSFGPGTTLSVDSIVFDEYGGTYGGGGATNVQGVYDATTRTVLEAGAHVNFTGTVVSVGAALDIVPSNANANANFSPAVPTTLTTNECTITGALTGTDSLVVTGMLTLSGSFDLGTTGTVDANGGLTIQTGYACQIQGVTLNNHGAATMAPDGYNGGVGLGNGAVFNNLAGATLAVEGTTGFSYGGGVMGAINNAGTVTVANAGGVHWGVPVTSSGAIDVTSGSLGLDGSGSFTGSALLTGAAGTSIGLDGPFSFGPGTTLSVDSIVFDEYGGTYGGGGATNVQGVYDATTRTVLEAGAHVNFTGTVVSVGAALDIVPSNANANANFSPAVPTTLTTNECTITGALTGTDSLVVTGMMTLSGSFDLGTTGTVDANGGLIIQTGYACQIQGVTLNNHGSATVSGSYGVGVGNGAVFNNLAGATFDVQGDIGFGYGGGAVATLNNAGTLFKSAGTGTSYFQTALNNSGAMEVKSGSFVLIGGPPAVAINTGTLTVDAGATFSSYSLVQNSGATVLNGGSLNLGFVAINAGILSGSGTINAGLTNGGQVIPGGVGALGTLTVNGTYTQTTAGSLNVEIGSGGSDLLAVSGSAALGGAVNIADLSNAAFSTGTSFTVMTFASSTGGFAAYNGLGIKNSQILSPSLNPTSLTLTVQADHPPVVGPISGPSNSVLPIVPISLGATFTDQDTFETHTAVWNWGDGNTTTGTVSESGESGSITGSHPYSAHGSYTVILTVTDSDGASGSMTKTVVVSKAAVTIGVTPSITTPLFGVDTVTFTTSVNAAVAGYGSPTGSVQFAVDGTNVGSPVLLVGGTAAFSSSTLAVGGHTVTATYSGDGTFQAGTGTTTVNVIAPASLSGVVFSDFNHDGQVDFGEHGISGVPITLTGTDDLGHSVNLSQATDSAGTYVFLNLRPGSYTITEAQQPTGYAPGIASVGTSGGTVSGARLTVSLAAGVDAMNYNYGEQPVTTGHIQSDQTAGIGFWNNKNGQALIKALNGGVGTELGDWLAASFPHMFGASSGSNDLAGKNNAFVASYFQSQFVVHGVKLNAQVLATALSVYVTNATLDNTGVGTLYDFTVSGNGVGTAGYNVGDDGAAFGVANNTTMSVMDFLLAVDAQSVNGVLYNGDESKRDMANEVFSEINEGD